MDYCPLEKPNCNALLFLCHSWETPCWSASSIVAAASRRYDTLIDNNTSLHTFLPAYQAHHAARHVVQEGRGVRRDLCVGRDIDERDRGADT